MTCVIKSILRLNLSWNTERKFKFPAVVTRPTKGKGVVGGVNFDGLLSGQLP